jgi:hypothetical protein
MSATEPCELSSYPHTLFLKDIDLHLNIILPSTPITFPSSLFPSDFFTKVFYALLTSPMHATYPTHIILLDLITLILILKVAAFKDDYAQKLHMHFFISSIWLTYTHLITRFEKAWSFNFMPSAIIIWLAAQYFQFLIYRLLIRNFCLSRSYFSMWFAPEQCMYFKMSPSELYIPPFITSLTDLS